MYCTTLGVNPWRDSVIKTSAALLRHATLCGGHQLVIALNSNVRSSLRASSSAGDAWLHSRTRTFTKQNKKPLSRLTPATKKLCSVRVRSMSQHHKAYTVELCYIRLGYNVNKCIIKKFDCVLFLYISYIQHMFTIRIHLHGPEF